MPVSNKCQSPECMCFTYCTHAESSYLTVKLASSDLQFVERSAVCRAISLSSKFLLTFATLHFYGVLIFALIAHPQRIDAQIISLIQRLCSTAKILLREYFRKYITHTNRYLFINVLTLIMVISLLSCINFLFEFVV